MCGRKYDSEEAAYERAFHRGRHNFHSWWRSKDRERQTDLFPMFRKFRSYDIRPTNLHPVINGVDDTFACEVMTWGFQPGWSKRILINSRGDKLEGRTWGKAFRERRCIIPVGGFYEWSGPKKARQPHAFFLADSEVMLLAGLWFEHEGERCYTVVTTDASKWMSDYHDREPVIIRPEDVDEWLLSGDQPWDLVAETEDGELEEFPCKPLTKDMPPAPVGGQGDLF